MIYLDNAATTKVNKKVLESMMPYFSEIYCNPSAAYSFATKGRIAIEEARNYAAKLIGASDMEIYFTSGGSESDNWAIKAVAESFSDKGKNIITTKIEHHAVLHTCEYLERHGFDITYLNVDSDGKVRLDELKKSIREDTILVSTMYVNNEVGTINPIHKIASIVHKKNPKTKYHVDMVQALGKLPITLDDIDLATFSAHKVFGLKGSGLLYKKRTASIVPLINGGQQENGLRGGTSTACVDIVLAKTMRKAIESQKNHYDYVKSLNDYLRVQLSAMDNVVINSPEDASPFILNISCPHYKPEVIVHDLETKGIYISTKSACSSKKVEISHTLAAMHLDPRIGTSALRLSFSHLTTKEELDTFLDALKDTLNRIKKQR